MKYVSIISIFGFLCSNTLVVFYATRSLSNTIWKTNKPHWNVYSLFWSSHCFVLEHYRWSLNKILSYICHYYHRVDASASGILILEGAIRSVAWPGKELSNAPYNLFQFDTTEFLKRAVSSYLFPDFYCFVQIIRVWLSVTSLFRLFTEMRICCSESGVVLCTLFST